MSTAVRPEPSPTTTTGTVTTAIISDRLTSDPVLIEEGQS